MLRATAVWWERRRVSYPVPRGRISRPVGSISITDSCNPPMVFNTLPEGVARARPRLEVHWQQSHGVEGSGELRSGERLDDADDSH